MQQFPSYWTLNDKVDFLQRKILLNSVAEKQLDIHLLDDKFKDDILHQLIDLQKEDTTKTPYGYVFENFTIDDYPDLYSRLNALRTIAKIIRRQNRLHINTVIRP